MSIQSLQSRNLEGSTLPNLIHTAMGKTARLGSVIYDRLPEAIQEPVFQGLLVGTCMVLVAVQVNSIVIPLLVTSCITFILTCTLVRGNSNELNTAFQYRVSHPGTFPSIFFLIAAGAGINDLDGRTGRSPLIQAIINHDHEGIWALIDAGADVHLADRSGWTALICAARNGFNELVQELSTIEGINLNQVNREGRSALSYAAENGRTEVVHALILEGVDVNLIDRNASTALIHAISQRHVTIAQELLNVEGINLNQVNQEGLSALDCAVEIRDVGLIQSLIRLGANFNGITIENQPLLLWAARNGHAELLQLLLDRELAVDTVFEGGMTALMHAAENGHADAVRSLLAAGADVTIRNSAGRTVLELDLREEVRRVFTQLAERRAALHDLGLTATLGDQDVPMPTPLLNLIAGYVTF